MSNRAAQYSDFNVQQYMRLLHPNSDVVEQIRGCRELKQRVNSDNIQVILDSGIYMGFPEQLYENSSEEQTLCAEKLSLLTSMIDFARMGYQIDRINALASKIVDVKGELSSQAIWNFVQLVQIYQSRMLCVDQKHLMFMLKNFSTMLQLCDQYYFGYSKNNFRNHGKF